MKDEKFSIDILIVFSFMVCVVLLFTDLYASHYSYLRESNMANFHISRVVRILYNQAPIFEYSILIRFFCLLLFIFSCFGIKVKKVPENHDKLKSYIIIISVSVITFLITPLVHVGLYIDVLFSLSSFVGTIWSFMHIRRHFDYYGNKDEFNEKNQVFQQESVLKENPYSVNFKTDNGLVNVVNPFRATMVLGTPGSGKSYSVIEEYIRQHIKKQFTMLVYDFKFPALANETYAFFEYYKQHYKKEPKFTVISLDDLRRSNFVNPISPNLIGKAADAIEASQTVLYNLNKEWITKKDFFAQSAISYFA